MEDKLLLEKFTTPFFTYNIDILLERINYLKKYLSNCNLCFAIKANSFIVKEISNYVSRFEVCSDGEYQICKNLNIDKNKIVLSGVNKNIDDFELIFKNNDCIGVFTSESITQYNMLSSLCKKYNKHISMLLRLTSNNQFGMTEEEIINIISNKNDYIDIIGIEYFSGTQKYSIKRVNKELNYLKEFITNIEDNYNFIIKEIEYGPGLPVYYFSGEDFNEIEHLEELNKLVYELFKDKVVTLEIGRSIVASCGKYYSRVVDVKTNKSGNFAIIDGGINHLVYYGQTMAMKVPIYKLIQDTKKENSIFNICGSLCTINDIIVKALEVPHLSIGDTFIFYNVGAYSSTEGMNLFLSRDLPKIILIKDNVPYIVRGKVGSYILNCPKYEGGK